jgi:hypothetical protein
MITTDAPVIGVTDKLDKLITLLSFAMTTILAPKIAAILNLVANTSQLLSIVMILTNVHLMDVMLN